MTNKKQKFIKKEIRHTIKEEDKSFITMIFLIAIILTITITLDITLGNHAWLAPVIFILTLLGIGLIDCIDKKTTYYEEI